MVRGAEESKNAVPVCSAAADLLSPRFKDLAQAAKNLTSLLAQDTRPEDLEPAVHKVRVAARRIGVALDAFQDCCRADEWKLARKTARRVRKAAGDLRDADVQASLVTALRGHEQAAPGAAVEFVLDRIDKDRERGDRRLRRMLDAGYPKRLRRAARALIDSIHETDLAGTLEQTGSAELSRLAHEVVTLGGERLEEPTHLHELRLAVKRLRYTLEVFSSCLRAPDLAQIMPVLEEAQKQAGEVNDVLMLVQRLRAYTEELDPAKDTDQARRAALAGLCDRFLGVGDRRCARFAQWWRDIDAPNLLTPLLDLAPLSRPNVTGSFDEDVPTWTQPVPMSDVVVNGAPNGERPGNRSTHAASSQRNLWLSGQRLAVIDIGSNSIRLLAVELIDERSWRPLAEERAMTRLAAGMGKGGLLCPEAMARSVEAVGRFKAIAEKLGVTTVKAFATAAVREAKNKADFISLIEDRTGLKLELVSALDEGKLTHRSVARVFDLSHGSAAVVDIGGGSMEVVFSCNGVITENSSMPLGAVRVTEAFGGADECAQSAFKKMRRWVQKDIARHVRLHEAPPAVLVGCGGAFTTLLTLAAASRGILIDRSSTALASLGPVARTQVNALIEELRAMTLEQRLRVPGLPSDRADIIIAGLTAIERLMKHLGVSQVHVHPGGFREGLLLRMIDQEIAERARAGADPTDADLARAARDLASRAGYDRPHSEHVARLALSLFDQLREESTLIPGLGAVRHERAILEAAAILHDVGLVVEYTRHHKHSQTIIRHADLHGWSPRHVEVLATVARYHRRSLPSLEHEEFAALTEPERQLVRRLAAILRVADGLDRSHSQTVHAVRLRFGSRGVQVEVVAATEPSVDLKAARKKSDLLADLTGVSLNFAVSRSQPRPPAGRAPLAEAAP